MKEQHYQDSTPTNPTNKEVKNNDDKPPELINRSNQIKYGYVHNDDDQLIDNSQGNNDNKFEVNIDYEEYVSIINDSLSPVQYA